MSIQTDVKNGKISNAYLIYGSEAYKRKVLKDFLIAKIPYGESMNFSYYEGKNINFSDVYDNVVTLPFFSDYRLVVVENTGLFAPKKKNNPEEDGKEKSKQSGTQANDVDAGQSSEQNSEQASEQNAEQQEKQEQERENEAEKYILKMLEELPPTTVLVFVEESAAKNKKIYKELIKHGSAEICENDKDGEPFSDWIKKGFAQSGKNIDSKTANMLVERTGEDYTKLRREIEKLINYVGDAESVTKDDIEAIASIDIEAKIFDMIRFLCTKNIQGVLKEYNKLLSVRAHPLMILAMLRKQFESMLETAELGNKRMSVAEIAATTGNKGKEFVIKNNMQYMRKYYKMKDVRDILELINDADMKMKTGELDMQIGVEMLLVKIAS